MPTNIIKINNALRFEVPDSWMPVLIGFLNLMKEKTTWSAMDKTMLVVDDLLKHGWKVKLVGKDLLAKKGNRKWLVKTIWGEPDKEPTSYKCEDCGSKKLFKGSLCEDCWYKKELKEN